MDAAQQNVRYYNTATLANVRTVIILGDPGARRREKSWCPPWHITPESPRTGNNKSTWKNDRKLHFINQRRTPINRRPRKNAGSKLLILYKRRMHLIKKINKEKKLIYKSKRGNKRCLLKKKQAQFASAYLTLLISLKYCIFLSRTTRRLQAEMIWSLKGLFSLWPDFAVD